MSLAWVESCEGWRFVGSTKDTGADEWRNAYGFVKTGDASRGMEAHDTTGRWGEGGFRWISGYGDVGQPPGLNIFTTEIIWGAHISTDPKTGTTAWPVIAFESAVDNTRKGTLIPNENIGIWEFEAGDGTVYPTTHLLTHGSFEFIELRLKVGEFDGEFEMRVNQGPSQSTTVADLSGINTKGASANAYINQIQFGRQTGESGLTFYMDDMHLINVDGDSPSGFLGDGRIYTLLPDGDASPNQFSIVGAAVDHYDAVNDIAEVDHAEYLKSGFTGNEEVWDLLNLTDPTETIDFVTSRSVFWKPTAGDATVQSFLQQGASRHELELLDPPGTRRHFHGDSYIVNPVTGSPWTFAEINNLQAGVKVVL